MLNLNEKLEAGKDVGEAIQVRTLVDLINKALSPDSAQYTAISEEIELTNPDKKTLRANVSVIRDRDGLDLGVVSTFRDITSLKELDQVKSQFVSMVTHELRAPLSAVEGYLSAYLSGAAGNDPQMNRQMLERAKTRKLRFWIL